MVRSPFSSRHRERGGLISFDRRLIQSGPISVQFDRRNNFEIISSRRHRVAALGCDYPEPEPVAGGEFGGGADGGARAGARRESVSQSLAGCRCKMS